MGGGLKISKGLIFAEPRSGFGRRYIPEEACFPRVFEVAYLAADSDRIPKRLLNKRVGRRWGNKRGQLCAPGVAQRKVKHAHKGAAIPEESLGAQKIQTHLTLKIRGLTAFKGHRENGLGSPA